MKIVHSLVCPSLNLDVYESMMYRADSEFWHLTRVCEHCVVFDRATYEYIYKLTVRYSSNI